MKNELKKSISSDNDREQTNILRGSFTSLETDEEYPQQSFIKLYNTSSTDYSSNIDEISINDCETNPELKSISSFGYQLPKPRQYKGFWVGTGSAIEEDPFNESNSIIEAVRLLQNGLVQIKTFKKRWLILLVYCIVSLSNSLFWVTFASIAETAEEYYSVGIFSITSLSLVYFVMYIPSFVFSSWTIDFKDIRISLIIGCILFSIGSFLRVISAFGSHYYWVLLIGQITCATSVPFIQSASLKITNNWFPEDSRNLATSIAAFCYPIGSSMGVTISSLCVTYFKDGIAVVLIFQFLNSLFSLLLVIIFFQSYPLKPPSITALQLKLEDDRRREKKWTKGSQMEYLSTIRMLFRNRDYFILFLIYSLNSAGFHSLVTLLNQILSPYGYSVREIGWMGTSGLYGVLGTIILGILLDRMKSGYKLMMFILYAFSVFFGILWATFLPFHSYLALYITGSLYLFFVVPSLPAAATLVGECTYPIRETLPIGLMVMGGMALSVIVTSVMTLLLHYFTEYGSIMAISIIVFPQILSYILIIFYRETTNRWEEDKIWFTKVSKVEDDHDGDDDDDNYVEPNEETSLFEQ